MLTKDAARRLGISPATLRRFEKAGRFAARRDLNNWRRYTEADLAVLERLLYPSTVQEGSSPVGDGHGHDG